MYPIVKNFTRKLSNATERFKNLFFEKYDYDKLKENLLSNDASVRTKTLDVLSSLADPGRIYPGTCKDCYEDFIDILLNNLSMEYSLTKNAGDRENFLMSLKMIHDISILNKLQQHHDWDLVLPFFNKNITDEELTYLLDVLENSSDVKNIYLIKKYINYPDPFVRTSAQSAIDEINYRVYGIKPDKTLSVTPEDISKYEEYRKKLKNEKN